MILKFKTYNCPKKWMPGIQLEMLKLELQQVALECLGEVPNYQCLRDDGKDLDRLLISVARSEKGELLGFCSSYILDFNGEKILHLGLTCVSKKARGLKLTHKLTSKVVTAFLLHYSLTKASWVTNVACVLSSLGNLANYFDEVYPSPFGTKCSDDHQAISQYIEKNAREELFIRKEAHFNPETFVFEGSVLGNMFQKELTDKQYYHRNPMLNQFYKNLINFERGDEVLQVAKVSWLTFPKYAFKKMSRKFLARYQKAQELAVARTFK